ncbi:MAG TPA: protein kinase [Blastocatellia bacterium]|nr:protein kinase [Blastocatellia bacterium]
MLSPGSVVYLNYEIVRQVGQGGMGAVYEAINQKLECRVALKQMLVNANQFGEAFRREAMLLARLRHPALPKVFDYFIENGTPFLAMEYIPGPDLAEMLAQQRRPFPVNDVLRWADTLLDALDYLHTQTPSIVHRDIKPQNLKLTDRGDVILLDFGLAKGFIGLNSSTQTVKSVSGWTPQYAPLEQINGEGTDARSDIYSLAATLYALLTAQTPASATARATELVAHRPDPLRPIGELNPSIPHKTAGAIMYALGMDPAHRFASATAMKAAIRPEEKSMATARTVTTQPEVMRPTVNPQGQTVVEIPAADTLKTQVLQSPVVATPNPASPSNVATVTRQPATPVVAVARKRTGLWIGVGAFLVVIAIAIGGGVLLLMNRKAADSGQTAVTQPGSASNSGTPASSNSAGVSTEPSSPFNLTAASTPIIDGVSAGDAVFEVLGVEWVRNGSRVDLKLRVRMNWNGRFQANIKSALFRLLVDGQTLNPREDLNELVDAYASNDVSMTFQIPSTATKAILQVGLSNQETNQIDIDIKSAAEKTKSQLAALKSPEWKYPVYVASGQSKVVANMEYKLLGITLEHHSMGKNSLEFQIRMINNTKGTANFWGRRFRLIVNNASIAPDEPPDELCYAGDMKDGRFVFIIPDTVTKVQLKVGEVGQETDIIPIDLNQRAKE